jgi:hypothetical protein
MIPRPRAAQQAWELFSNAHLVKASLLPCAALRRLRQRGQFRETVDASDRHPPPCRRPP